MNSSKIKVVSLFSGIGGFEVGLKMSNILHEIVFSSEIDRNAQKSYCANFTDNNLHGDITKINEKFIPNHNLLCAGFPCQAFSIAGQMNGFNDTRGTLFFDVARILKEKKPRVVLLENVKNLASHDKSRTIKVILKTLNNLGYTVDFSIINSNESGLPQNRDRTYIIGVFEGEVENFDDDVRSRKVTNIKRELQKENFKGFNFFNTLKFKCKQSSIIDIINNDVDKKYYYDSVLIKEFLSKLELKTEEIKTNRIIKILDIPKDVHNDLERQRRVYSIYGISPTILARSDSTKILLLNKGVYSIRKFTPIENLLAQGFDMEFINNINATGISDTQLYKQSGNAVSPPIIKKIAEHLMEVLSHGL